MTQYGTGLVVRTYLYVINYTLFLSLGVHPFSGNQYYGVSNIYIHCLCFMYPGESSSAAAGGGHMYREDNL